MLLGPREDMDQIADAIRKIQRQAGACSSAPENVPRLLGTIEYISVRP